MTGEGTAKAPSSTRTVDGTCLPSLSPSLPLPFPTSNPSLPPCLPPSFSYVGEHAFDKADGQGKEYYKDGGRYEGEEKGRGEGGKEGRREGGTEGDEGST